MTPNEIKADLVRKGISLTEIANITGSTVPEVSRCISGNGLYRRVRKAIARKLGKKVAEVFAEHHPQPKATSSRWCKQLN